MPLVVAKAYIYLITYPNGKIYIGQDRTDDINYFGSANGTVIEKDFTRDQMRDFSIRKQILIEFENILLADLNKQERLLIEAYKSNNPEIGYNRSPIMPRKKQHIYESNPNQPTGRNNQRGKR